MCAPIPHATILFRDGAIDLLETVERHHVPMVLFSAGIGNIIETFLRSQLRAIPPALHIVSNMMLYDENVSSIAVAHRL